MQKLALRTSEFLGDITYDKLKNEDDHINSYIPEYDELIFQLEGMHYVHNLPRCQNLHRFHRVLRIFKWDKIAQVHALNQ